MGFSLAFKKAMVDIVQLTPVSEVAEKTGVHRSTLYHWLNGYVPADKRRLVQFSERLELSESTQQLLLEAAGITRRGDIRAVTSVVQKEETDSTPPSWQVGRRRVLADLNDALSCILPAYVEYRAWCTQHELTPQLPDWRLVLSLVLSDADRDEVDHAIEVMFQLLRAHTMGTIPGEEC